MSGPSDFDRRPLSIERPMPFDRLANHAYTKTFVEPPIIKPYEEADHMKIFSF